MTGGLCIVSADLLKYSGLHLTSSTSLRLAAAASWLTLQLYRHMLLTDKPLLNSICHNKITSGRLTRKLRRCRDSTTWEA